MLLISNPGIYKDMPTAEYFGDPIIKPSFTQSLAKILLDQSPLHAKMAHPRLNPPDADDEDVEKYNKAQAIGNAAHALMLDRGKDMAVADLDNWRGKAGTEFRAKALVECKEPILGKHYQIAGRMVDAALEQMDRIRGCENAFKNGDAEVVAVNCEDGIWLRTMIDWITPDQREVWDYKTSGMSASPYNIDKQMAGAGWHIQAAMHQRILDVLDPAGAGRRRYLYVCQEQDDPFALTVNEIGEAALTIGRKQIDYAIKSWAHCLTKNIWPGYPNRINRAELPAWAENGWLSREIVEEYDRQTAPTKFDPKVIMGG